MTTFTRNILVDTNTVNCSDGDTDNCHLLPIKIYLIDNGRISTMTFTFISDIYAKIRKRFFKDYRHYKHYYHEFDIPKFYLIYQGKPLFESMKTYVDFNIHNRDYLYLEYAALSGGRSGDHIIPYVDVELDIGDEITICSVPAHLNYFGLIRHLNNNFIHPFFLSRPCFFEIRNVDRQERDSTSVTTFYGSPLTLDTWGEVIRSFTRVRLMYDFDECDDSYHYVNSPLRSYIDSLTPQSLVEDSYTWVCKQITPHKYSQEYIIKLIEDLMVLVNGIRKSIKDNYNVAIIMEYVIIFMKLRSLDSLTKTLRESGIVDYISYIINDCKRFMTPQASHPFFESARKVLSDIRLGKETEFYLTAYRIGLFVLTTSLFTNADLILENMGYNAFEIKHLKKKNRMSGNLALDLAEGAVYLLDKGHQIILTRSFDCLYHDESEYGQLYDTIMDLKTKQHALANPEAFGFTESWYIKTLNDTMDKLRSAIKYVGKIDPKEVKQFRHYLYELETIRISRVLTMVTQEYRQAPFSLLFFAQPGVGKTSLLKITFKHFAATHGLPDDDCFMYTRNPGAKYADGFRTEQWCWVQDDVAFLRPDKNPTGDTTSLETIQVNNIVQFTPDQAAIENKGVTPFRGKLLMGTTNIKDINAYHYFSCPAAVQRRYPYVVEVHVKPEYRRENSKMLDSAKVNIVKGEYPDLWIFTVYRVKIPHNLHALAEHVVVASFSDINDFLVWVSEASIQHVKEQSVVMESFKDLKTIDICKMCYKNKKICACEAQVAYEISMCICALTSMYATYKKFPNFWSFLKHSLEDILVSLLMLMIYFSSGFLTVLFYFRFRFWVINTINKLHLYGAAIKIERQFFVNMGSQVKQAIGSPKHFKWLAGAIVSCYSIIRLMEYFKTSELIEQSEEAREPVPFAMERVNPWVASDFKLSTLHLTPSILSSKQHSDEDFIKLVERNVIYASVHDILTGPSLITKRWHTNILCIKGNIYVANAHWLYGLDKTKPRFAITVFCDDSGEGIRNKLSFTLNFSDLLMYDEQDLVFFELPHLVPRKDITSYFPSQDVKVRSSGSLLTRLKDGKFQVSPAKNVYIQHDKNSITGRDFDHKITMGVSAIVTEDGNCGSPLVLHSPRGHIIVSIHRAGNADGVIMGTCVFKEQVSKALSYFTSGMVVAGIPSLKPEHLKLQSLHDKSTIRYMESGVCEVYGSLVGFKTKHKSRVCPTIMRDFLENHGYKVKVTAPNLGGWKPWRLALDDLTKPITLFDTSLVRECSNAVLTHITSRLTLEEISHTVEKYDQFTAINGARAIAYVDKINRNTSAGYPYYKQKCNFMKSLPPQRGLNEPVGVDNVIQDRINSVLAAYEAGEQWHPIFVASLKDEPISFAKALLQKVRVFGSAPADWIIVVRMYLLSFIRLMQNNRLKFECAIGVVAQSREWNDLYSYITEFGEDNMIAGDFKKFDKKMSPVFIRSAFDIISSICKLSGNYDDQDIRAIQCIAADTAYPLMDFNGDLIQFYGSNPSGHSLTVIINSLVNSIYMRYVFVLLWFRYENKSTSVHDILNHFSQKVKLLTYGDDNVLNVCSSIPWYNHTTIAEAFLSFGIEYTMADKESSSIPYINIKDISFLKRSWVWDPKIKTYLAPLEHDSIEKMLTTWVSSDSISSESQCLDVLSSALREYFFYGEDIFKEKRELFQTLLDHLNLSEFRENKTILPTYEMLRQQYEENSVRLVPSNLKIQSFEEEISPFNLDNLHYLQTMYKVYTNIVYIIWALMIIVPLIFLYVYAIQRVIEDFMNAFLLGFGNHPMPLLSKILAGLVFADTLGRTFFLISAIFGY